MTLHKTFQFQNIEIPLELVNKQNNTKYIYLYWYLCLRGIRHLIWVFCTDVSKVNGIRSEMETTHLKRKAIASSKRRDKTPTSGGDIIEDVEDSSTHRTPWLSGIIVTFGTLYPII